MSLRTTTSYSRAPASVVIINATASAAPPILVSICVLPGSLDARQLGAALLQQLERVAKPRCIRAVFLPLRPDIDDHVDSVARRHDLNLMRGVAGIRNAVDAGFSGD